MTKWEKHLAKVKKRQENKKYIKETVEEVGEILRVGAASTAVAGTYILLGVLAHG